MATDMFFKIGDIKGESQDKAHGGEIDVLAWSWGVTNEGSEGDGRAAGKVNVQDLSITKFVDTSSTDLLLASCSGKHFPDATIVVRKAGENPLEYLIVKLDDVTVRSYSTGGSGGEDRLTETIALNFHKLRVDYTAADGSVRTANWSCGPGEHQKAEPPPEGPVVQKR